MTTITLVHAPKVDNRKPQELPEVHVHVCMSLILMVWAIYSKKYMYIVGFYVCSVSAQLRNVIHSVMQLQYCVSCDQLSWCIIQSTYVPMHWSFEALWNPVIHLQLVSPSTNTHSSFAGHLFTEHSANIINQCQSCIKYHKNIHTVWYHYYA